ncbi:MAG TPA: serine/threonine-protein kinase, partial [Chthoniobacterales bacterium]|nr:serine/threonine-protein kinase [Chthoniobacterales bacterium]
MELSGYALELLGKDQGFVLYRGRSKNGNAPSILLRTTLSAFPTPETIKKIEHEYSLKNELDTTWAARPMALSQYNERSALILEDPGGEPLNLLIQGPMGVKSFLDVAVSLANALRHLHKRRLIHKDLKPSNILVE